MINMSLVWKISRLFADILTYPLTICLVFPSHFPIPEKEIKAPVQTGAFVFVGKQIISEFP